MFEELRVIIDGEKIAEFHTSMDSPEDNNLSRMEVGWKIAKIVEALGGEVRATRVYDEEVWFAI